MVQIIQSQPTQRQSALELAAQQAVQGFGQAYQQGQQTQRQQALQALDTAIQLRGQGYDVAPQQVQQMYNQPQAGFGGIFDKRTAEFTAKQERESQKALKEQEKFQADIEKTAAETAKLGRVDPLENLKADELRQRLRLGKAQEGKYIAEAAKIANETSNKAAYGSGKQISAKDVATFQEGNQIPTMLADVKTVLDANKEIFDPIKGRISSMNPYNEQVQTVESQIRTASQAFGKYMEGGVLRPDDEAKYRKMFPNLTDTPEIAKNKLQIVNKILTDRQKGTLDALEKSGYNIGGIRKEFPQEQLPSAITGGMPNIKALSREEKIRILQGGA